jgi:hypothetical protein
LGLVGLLLVLSGIVGLFSPFPFYVSWPLLLGAGLVVCLVAAIKGRGRMLAIIGLSGCVLFLSAFFLARLIN